VLGSNAPGCGRNATDETSSVAGRALGRTERRVKLPRAWMPEEPAEPWMAERARQRLDRRAGRPNGARGVPGRPAGPVADLHPKDASVSVRSWRGNGTRSGAHGGRARERRRAPAGVGTGGAEGGGITEAGRRVGPMPEWRPVNAGTFAFAPAVEERVVALAASLTRTAV